jgi:hypothetical protein
VKTRYLLLGCLLVSAGAGTNDHSVTLSWTQSDSPNIVSNEVYCGRVSGGPYPFQRETLVPATSLAVPKVHSGTYYCVVTATDAQGVESGPSSELEVDVP